MLIEEAQNTPLIVEEVKSIVEDLTKPTTITTIDDIPDWEDRMNRANYTDTQRAIVRQAQQKHKAWLDFCNSNVWDVTETNEKHDYVISQCTSASGIPCMKSVGTINFSLMEIFCCLHNADYRLLYDENIEVAEVLSKVAANTYMIYQKTKSMFVVSSRDLVMCHHVARVTHPELCPNGGILIVAFTPTPEQDDLKPISKKAIRAHANVSTHTNLFNALALFYHSLEDGYWSRSVRERLKLR